MRRVGINLLYLVPGAVGGSEIYAHNLLSAIRLVAPELELVVYCAPEARASLAASAWAAGSGAQVTLRQAPGSSRIKPLRAMIEQTWLPARARADRVQLLHSLGTTGPALGRVPSVVSILDLIYHHFPETFPAPARLGLELIVPRAARHASRVIAISQFGAGDIAATLGIDPAKIDVVRLGPGSPPGTEFTPPQPLREKLGITGEVVLCVSAALAHKNLLRLIDAFRTVPSAVLVLVGHGGLSTDELKARAAFNGIADRVILTGWIDQPDLEGLYRIARVFAYPSLLEGFGLPILEAMARGVPVACANASSLPEVGGAAAEYFDPLDTGAIARALTHLLTDETRRAELSALGRARVSQFSWERCARETLAVYEQASLARPQ